jgi:hypothetical protein
MIPGWTVSLLIASLMASSIVVAACRAASTADAVEQAKRRRAYSYVRI